MQRRASRESSRVIGRRTRVEGPSRVSPGICHWLPIQAVEAPAGTRLATHLPQPAIYQVWQRHGLGRPPVRRLLDGLIGADELRCQAVELVDQVLKAGVLPAGRRVVLRCRRTFPLSLLTTSVGAVLPVVMSRWPSGVDVGIIVLLACRLLRNIFSPDGCLFAIACGRQSGAGMEPCRPRAPCC